MKKIVLVFFGLLALASIRSQTAADATVLYDFLKFADSKKLSSLPVGERIAKIATFFKDSPYVGSTLEVSQTEQLQVNLRQFDCNTFVENVLALNVLLDQERRDWFHFKQVLEVIRYRDGYVHGYPSRLHYASDWLHDNVAKAFFDWVLVPELEVPFRPSVNYMSTHPAAYPALRTNANLVSEIQTRELEINTWSMHYIPKARIKANALFLQTGDVVAITTNLAGLDFSHMGIVVRKKGKVYLLHASSTEKKVVLSKQTLSDYLAGIKKHTGVVAVRPK